MPNPFSTGDKILADDANKNLPITLNAGETITGATLPVPCFIDDTTDELLACDADDADRLNFDGFVVSTGNDGDPVTFQKDGVVDGFSGLDIGKEYYVQDSIGTIGTTQGTNIVLVGVAVSATQILIQHEKRVQSSVGKSVGTSYLAEADGFVIATLDNSAASSVSYLTGLTDSSNPPTTLVAYCSADYRTSPDIHYASMTFPVKKGDYYKVTNTGTAGTIVMNWIPFR